MSSIFINNMHDWNTQQMIDYASYAGTARPS